MRRLGFLVIAALAVASGCSKPKAPPPIVCDGELSEPLWGRAVRTGPFLGPAGRPSAPYSDARFLVLPDGLYVALYAASQKIHTADRFMLQIGDQTFTFHPNDRGADVGVDMDGTLDEDEDDDEEWLVEARLDLARLPHGRTAVTVTRCDGRGQPVGCGVAHLRVDLP